MQLGLRSIIYTFAMTTDLKHCDLNSDYFVIIERCRPTRAHYRKTHWTWEIRRRSNPSFSIKNDAYDFGTAQEAKLAGEAALKKLLDGKLPKRPSAKVPPDKKR
jgi:hypothetical protein